MRKLRYLGMTALVLGLGLQLAEPAEVHVGYHAILDHFFNLLSEGKPAEALDSIYNTSPYLEKIKDQVEQLKSQFVASSSNTFGKYRAHEILIEKEIASRYAYVYVFVAYDRQPLRMEFHFYRPQEKWVLQKFAYSADVDDDIAKFAKYDLVK